jgi:protein tyrosine phosphatase (PTP) superfamily phosphohydrolase (DUF442 family)
MVAPVDPNGINKLGSPGKLDHEIESWGFIHGRVRRLRLIVAAIVLGAGVVTLVVAFLLYRLGGDNYHEVVNGELYRSRELTPDQLQRHVRTDEIATVLRLVGTQDSNVESYETERQAVNETDAQLIVAPLPSSRLPYRHELKRLFEALNRVKTPVLVHCRHGSDRTGLVSVIWLHDKKGVPMEEAREQLAFFPYGHVPVGSARPMGEFLDMFEQHVRDTGEKLSIEEWVKLHYFHEKKNRAPEPWLDGKLYQPVGS